MQVGRGCSGGVHYCGGFPGAIFAVSRVASVFAVVAVAPEPLLSEENRVARLRMHHLPLKLRERIDTPIFFNLTKNVKRKCKLPRGQRRSMSEP
ncbi:hypothetical protein NL676_034486 [Syzygium grande]|nr:hypothetical protein NL676_034486 [Syzygium grande]